ncbi:hypothetical protein llap_1286 [Limosa lapponica baueri]|uniref:Uncharacterized protein n=1 Tax=Limosa lapponica baueri TaxID=1758121 RepID=A0A2I0UQR1_LIMLA|nr:hypothetical protein llap_1286 [Limosa lapponica baueri]
MELHQFAQAEELAKYVLVTLHSEKTMFIIESLFFFAATGILSKAKHVAPCLRYENCMFIDTYNSHGMNDVDNENRCWGMNGLEWNQWFCYRLHTLEYYLSS